MHRGELKLLDLKESLNMGKDDDNRKSGRHNDKKDKKSKKDKKKKSKKKVRKDKKKSRSRSKDRKDNVSEILNEEETSEQNDVGPQIPENFYEDIKLKEDQEKEE